MIHKSAADIAAGLRQIRQDKILTIDANGKRMSADKLNRMRGQVEILNSAIEALDNLARVQRHFAERQAQQQEVAS